MVYVRYPLLLRQVEDILFERGIDISHDTVRFWWNRFGPLFASEICRKEFIPVNPLNDATIILLLATNPLALCR